MANLSNINNKFLVTTGGNVLIGQTADDGNRLQIDGDAIIKNGTYGKILLRSSSNYLYGDVNGVLIAAASDNLRLYTAGTQRLRIDSSGLINFSKTATTATAVASINHASNDFLYINGGTAGASFGDDNQSTRMICYNNDYIRFDSAAVERMRLTPDGNNTFLIIKAKPATYNSKSFITLYGTNSSTYGGSVIARSSISSETDGTAYGANLKFYTNDSSNVEQTRITVLSDGNVGIGTAVPGGSMGGYGLYTKLDVVSSGNQGWLRVASGATGVDVASIWLHPFDFGNAGWQMGTNNDGKLRLGYGSGASEEAAVTSAKDGSSGITIQTNGNVGIGVTSPGQPLEVAGNIKNTTYINTGGQAGAMLLGRGNAISGSYLANDFLMFNTGGDCLILGTGGAGMIVKATTGNVGIGATSPQQKLHIVDTDGANIILNSNTGAENNGIWMTEGGAATPYANGAYVHYDSTNNAFKINTGTTSLTTKLTILRDNGNVGIGTTSPTTGKLVVVGSPYVITDSGRAYGGIDLRTPTNAGNGLYSAGISFGGSSTASAAISGVQQNVDGDVQGLAFFTHGSSGSTADSAERMRITSAGTVGNTGSTTLGGGGGEGVTGWNFAPTNGLIITSSDSDSNMYISKISGYSNNVFISFYVNSSYVGKITTSGSSTSYVTTSDYRLKENVVEMTGALDRVSQLKPSRFNFIADADRTVDGFLAHEVQEIVPEAISGEKDAVDEEGNPEYQGIDQSKLVPLLVAAIQELKAEIELLKSK